MCGVSPPHVDVGSSRFSLLALLVSYTDCSSDLIENILICDFDSYPFKLVQLRLSLLPRLTPFLLFSALALNQVFTFNWFHNIVFKRLDDLPQGIINCRLIL